MTTKKGLRMAKSEVLSQNDNNEELRMMSRTK